jgi:signal transduction histidine kinase
MKKIDIKKYNLKFKNIENEQQFKNEYFNESLNPMRIAIIFAITLYALFGIPDLLNYTESTKIGLIIRYFIFVPYMILVFFTTKTKFFRNYGQILYGITIFLAGITVLIMASLKVFEHDFLHLFGLTIVLIYCFSFSRLLFIASSVTSVFLFFGYIITFIYIYYNPNIDDKIIMTLAFFAIFYFIVIVNGIISSFTVEMLYRLNFLQRLAINTKNEQLEYSNQNLQNKNVIISEQVLELDELNNKLSLVNLELSEQFTEMEIMHNQQKSLNNQISEKNINLSNLNNELNEANATKDKFFSIISHDLKNPLGAIRNYTELLKFYDKMSPEKRSDLVESINKTVNFVLDLLENLLTWSRSQTNRLVFNPEKTSISDLIDDVIELMKPIAQGKDIKINVTFSKISNCFIDKNMITTVMRNLVSNAIKFSNNGGRVDIEYGMNINDLIISVIDNGVGMSNDVKNNLFKIDYHHTEKGTNNETGTGLGLLLCKEFIDRHNGQINIYSKINQGSKFEILIPQNQ